MRRIYHYIKKGFWNGKAIIKTKQFGLFFLLIVFSNNLFSQKASIDSINKIIKSNSTDISKISQYRSYLRKSYNKADSLMTISFVKEANEVLKKIDLRKYAAVSEFFLGDAFMFVNNRPVAFTTYKNSLLIAEKYNDTSTIINSSQNINWFYKLYGDQESAIKYALIALKFSELKKINRGISINSMNIGHSLKQLKRINESLIYYRNSYKYAVMDNNSTMIPNALISIGNAFNEAGNLDSAFFYYSKARIYCQEHPLEKNAFATLLANFGDYYFKKQKIDSAINNFNSCLIIAREIKSPETICYALVQLSKLLSLKGRYSASNDSLFVALKIVEKEKLLEQKIEINKTLAENYYNQKDFSQSYSYLKIAQSYNDSLYNAESLKITNGLQIVYESEKKQNEILKLNISNNLVKQSNLLLKIQKDSILFRLKIESENKKLEEAKSRILDQKNELLLKQKKISEDSLMSLKLKITVAEFEAKTNALDAERNERRATSNLIYGLLACVIILIGARFFYLRNKLKNEIKLRDAEIKLRDSELKVGRLQIKPHTVFNMLNAITEAIATKGYNNAGTYLDKLKGLMSTILSNSELEQILLSNETEVLKDYLEIEKLRKKFNYTIITDISSELDSILILPTILLPFVENSILHGFSFENENQEGSILLKILERPQELLISITDNGIGRKATSLVRGFPSKKSMGTKITRERIENYNANHGLKTIFKTEDLNPGLRIEFNLFKEHAY